MNSSLRGKIALVTGSSGGIGSATSRALAENGATLALHFFRNLPEIEMNAAAFKFDLLKPGSAERLAAAVIKKFGRIDILVNNAGAVLGKDHFLDLSPKDWQATLRLNAEVPFLLSCAAFSAMKKSGGGRIINISSVAAKFGGSAHSLHYGAAKGALETLTVGLAREGAPHNILVNAVRAGVIDTPFHTRSDKNMKERAAMIPLKHMGRPEDVARMVVHLAGPGGDYITGAIVPVTGGE